MKVFIAALFILGSSVATRLLSSHELHKLFLRVAKNEGTQDDLRNIQDVFQIYKSASNAIQSRKENSIIEKLKESKSLLYFTTVHKLTAKPHPLPFSVHIQKLFESLTCLICRSGAAAFFEMIREGAADKTVIDSASRMCTSLGILSRESCRGVLELNFPIIAHILKTTPEATARTFCALVLQKSDDPSYCVIHDARFNWAINLPERNNVTRDKIPASNPKPLTIALLTDAHIDPLYVPNGVADCNEPTCCREGQVSRTQSPNEDYDIEEILIDNYVTKTNGDEELDLDIVKEIKHKKRMAREKRDTSPAGFWGDYRNCDTPVWAYDDVIKRISSTHRNVDVVYYMGDSIGHHIWETTYELINTVNAYTIDTMRKEFGDNVPVIPTIGNHDSQPTNQFAPITVKGDKLNTTWLYESLASKWDFYLTEEAKSSVRKLGAYSMLIRPGLRVISVNTNVAYKFNWWLVYDPLDAKQHLDWLVEELHKAELAGEKVHILAHMPPGSSDFIHTWTHEYNRIVNRFSATIAGEFNGHMHADEFKIFYSAEGGAPVRVAWGAGGATAYSDYNLNYKIASVDPNTFEPLNIANFVYNLTEANLRPGRRPHWFQLYDFRNSFGLSDLSPQSMDRLVRGMVTDKPILLAMYAAFYSKLSDTQWPYCDDECKIDKVCRIVVTVLWEREKCNELRRVFFSE